MSILNIVEKQSATNTTAHRSTSAAPPPWQNDNNEVFVVGLVIETDDTSELKRDFRRFFAKNLRVLAKVVNVIKMKHDLFIVELSRYIEKLAVLANRDKLLNVTIPIHIYSEKFEREKIKRKTLNAMARFQMERGHKVVVGDNNITVNGLEWKWDSQRNRLVKPAGENNTRKRDNWGVKRKVANLVVFGLDLKDWDGDKLKRELQRYFKRVLGVSATVKSVTKLKRILCVAELQSVEDKINILKYRHVLRSLRTNVYIYADRARRERIIVEALAQKAEQELAKGSKIRIEYLRLYVDGTSWVWSDDKQILVKEFENQPDKVVDNVERMERQRRKNNIIVQGFWIKSDNEDEIKWKLEQLFQDAFKTRFPITEVTKLNNALFLVKLASLQDKIHILKNKMSLVRGEYMFNPVSVYNDLTAEEKSIIQRMTQRAKVEKQKGNIVKIGYMRMYINNQKWVWSRAKKDLVPR